MDFRDSLSNTHTNRENMTNGRIAVMMDNSGTVNTTGQDILKQNTGAYLEMVDLSGDAKILRYAATGGMLAIPTQSQHPELVLQVVDYLRNDKEMNYLVQRGIEGEDAQWYLAGELNEDGTVNENIVAFGERNSLYGGNWICWSAFRNWDYQTLPAAENCISGYRDIWNDMNERSINNIMQAFTFDTTNYQNELAAIQSGLRRVRQAAEPGLRRSGNGHRRVHRHDGGRRPDHGHGRLSAAGRRLPRRAGRVSGSRRGITP